MMFWLFIIFVILACILYLLLSPMFIGIVLGYCAMGVDKVKKFLFKDNKD